MSEYQHTINLPKTDFPMRANLANNEPCILKRWGDMDIYAQLRQRRAGKKTFILHDGPPYANGDIHIGHAVNKILKDIILKSRSLGDYDAPYVPGWDCHGLPIELVVENKVGKVGRKVDAATFRSKCRDYAAQQVERQSIDFQRLGILGDWQTPYLTMAYQTEANIIRSLGKIIANGHLQQGERPVHWCLDCASTLAEAEVDYVDKISTAIDVCFPLSDQQALWSLADRTGKAVTDQGEGEIALVIWTTTPWTLPANQAVSVHPDIEYVLVQCQTEQGPRRLLLAEVLYEAAMQRYAYDTHEILVEFMGSALSSSSELMLNHPFYQRQVPVVLGNHVTTDAGTGAVHTAPAHGADDYLVGKSYGLPVVNLVMGNGCFVPDTELFAGQHIYKANAKIIELLMAQGRLLKQEEIKHRYPHCWRHKTPVIFRSTPQWFIGMDCNGLRKQALETAKEVTWLPKWGGGRMHGMLDYRPDWCISRQRTWGVPITIFVCKKSGQLHAQTQQLIEQIAARVEQAGIDAWFQLNAHELLGDDADNYDKITDTLDVWFDSGVTHSSILRTDSRLKFPADLYLEGVDQYRGWFQSSLLTSVAMHGLKPYESVLTHGFTVDAQGKKMSKSQGNVVAPQKIANSLGVDILRLWVAATDYRSEMNISDEILKRMVDVYRKIRNTARYLLSNLSDFGPNTNSVKYEQLLELDKWAIEQAMSLQEDIRAAYEDYQFHHIVQKLQQFCNVEMSGFYLDIVKDRLYTMPTNSLGRRSAQTAMYHIIHALVRWLAPLLSFTADEIWHHLPGDKEGNKEPSIFLELWYDNFPVSETSSLRGDYWQRVIVLRDKVSKKLEQLRVAEDIGSSLDAEITLYCDANQLVFLQEIGDELHFVFIVSSVTLCDLAKDDGQATDIGIDGIKIIVSIADYNKCVRCWHRKQDIGRCEKHPKLCMRCVENIDGTGELRCYA